MRALCCVLLSFIFYKLAKNKLDAGIFMDKSDTLWAYIWSTLFYVSLIAAVVLLVLGL